MAFIEVDGVPVRRDIVLYTIQRKSDGLYSRGGSNLKWGKIPKTWGLGPFKNHINQHCTDAYKFNLKAFQEHCKKYSWGNYYANPAEYGKYKLFTNRFPYWDCEVIIIAGDTTKRFPAPEWIWENAYKPFLLKKNNARYLDNVKEFAEYIGQEF